jgi:hypothetical protein
MLNCHEWSYEYYEWSIIVLYWTLTIINVVWVLQRIYRCIIMNVNCHECLYEYYKGSIDVLYWTLTITNSCMSITKDLSLYYTEC